VTLDEFGELCKKEWSECRGEPVTLWLTEKSYRELQQFAMEQTVLHRENGNTQLASRVICSQSGVPAQVGLHQSSVTNPVTKNPVRMKLARDQDAADIFSQRDKVLYTKVL
jgi:hypothetical protein